MEDSNFLALCMVACVVSFLGFVVENIWLSITKGYMDNRNMCFPFLIGYGIGMNLIYAILGTPKKLRISCKQLQKSSQARKVLVYFIAAMLCVSAGEIALGTFVEKVCHFCWWDYSWIPFHITQYTSLPTSSMFGTLITFFMDQIFMPLYNYFLSWDYNTLRKIAIPLTAIMVWDFLYNAYKMYKNQGGVSRWKVDTKRSRLYRILHT